ncbi:MAG TPA: collagen-like protein, partial [Enterobacter roggenkampii]|nr:collagen-like protein [Enterobacter roggenkampii]
MRYLQNENDTLIFKAGDTSETVRLSARNDNQPIIWSDGDTAEIHIDKDGAHVKTAPANLVVGSNNVTFSTSELSELPAGQYQLELWTKLASDESQAIWPSSGMLDFTIDRNADSLEGGAITTITLDTFKDQLNQAIKEAKEQAKPGKSAYQTWIDQGNKGTEQDFLNSLKGEKGETGATGETGSDGKPGLSAYQLAVNAGFRGTESEWLESLKGGPRGEQGEAGKNGQDGKSSYQIWLDAGNKGTETDFLNSLVGPRGEEGPEGKPGHDGQQGPQGIPGKDGSTPSFNFGTITTLPAGSPAKASLVKNDDGSYTISLSIPTGPKGETGGVNQVVKPEL